MTADVRQVGGTHYGPGRGHWDVCEEHDVGYLEGCATKYLVRWKKKGGAEDLRKSVTYLQKMGGRRTRRPVPLNVLDLWLAETTVGGHEARIIRLVLGTGYGRRADISEAIVLLGSMIQDAEETEAQHDRR